MRSSGSSALSLLFLAVASVVLSSAPSIAALPSQFNGPWEAFLNLSGCQLGDHNSAVPLLKDYLSHFGYLPDPHSNFSDAFDDALESALRTYQQNFGLDPTGSLDLSTINQLMIPRCGVADIINGTSTMASKGSHGRNLYAYFTGQPTWPPSQRDLTYTFTTTSAVSIDASTLRRVFTRAFARWSAATTLTFSEAADASTADITIGFYTGAHGDGEPFDGALGTLAHAFSPTDGRFHLDAAEQWVAEGDVTQASSDVAVDLESVAVHEIGHLLGLGHSSVAEAIMYPTIRTRTRKVELANDDVQGIQGLYGSNPNYKGRANSTTTPATTAQERDANDGGIRLVGSGWCPPVGRLLALVVVGLLVL